MNRRLFPLLRDARNIVGLVSNQSFVVAHLTRREPAKTIQTALSL